MRLTGLCILGIDPGLRITGFGVLDKVGQKLFYVASGCVKTPVGRLPGRLKVIMDSLREVIETHQPQLVVVEKVFVNINPQSTLLLGQARGAALSALGDFEIAEYAPRAIKLATVGFGGADKLQVAHMMRTLLKVEGRLTSDAADALAVALCHAQQRKLASLIAGHQGVAG